MEEQGWTALDYAEWPTLGELKPTLDPAEKEDCLEVIRLLKQAGAQSGEELGTGEPSKDSGIDEKFMKF